MPLSTRAGGGLPGGDRCHREQDVRQCRGNWTSEVAPAPATWTHRHLTSHYLCLRARHAGKAAHTLWPVRHCHVTAGHTLVTRWPAGVASPPRRHHLASPGGAPPSAARHQLAV